MHMELIVRKYEIRIWVSLDSTRISTSGTTLTSTDNTTKPTPSTILHGDLLLLILVLLVILPLLLVQLILV